MCGALCFYVMCGALCFDWVGGVGVWPCPKQVENGAVNFWACPMAVSKCVCG